MIIKGKIHRFGNDINTDDIIAAKYLNTTDSKELGRHCMETIVPNFVQKVTKGDIIVAGKNFGCGSSREHAPLAIKGCGVSCVIAKSFARIFYRNAINIGLPIVELKQVSAIKANSLVEVDLNRGQVKIKGGKILKTEVFPEFLQGIIRNEGLLKWAINRKRGK